MPSALGADMVSPSSSAASSIVSTVLDLSIGVTRLTSPNCNALK